MHAANKLLLGYRYIVCKGKRADCTPIMKYMFSVNEQLGRFSGALCDDDVTHVVPNDVLKSDETFYEYIYNSNNVYVFLNVSVLSSLLLHCV